MLLTETRHPITYISTVTTALPAPCAVSPLETAIMLCFHENNWPHIPRVRELIPCWAYLPHCLPVTPFCYKCQDFLIFKAKYCPIVNICHIWSIHSSPDGYLGWFYLHDYCNNVMKTGIQTSIQHTDFIFSCYTHSWDLSPIISL